MKLKMKYMGVSSLSDWEKHYRNAIKSFWEVFIIVTSFALLIFLAMAFFYSLSCVYTGNAPKVQECKLCNYIRATCIATVLTLVIFYPLLFDSKAILDKNRKLVEIFKNLGLLTAKWVDNTLVYLYEDTFIVGLFDEFKIYFIKFLRYKFIDGGKISLPIYTFHLEPIYFRAGIAYFKHGNVVIRDLSGNYLKGEACVLIIPMETMDAILKEYSKPDEVFKQDILVKGIKILNEKCLKALEKKQKFGLLSFLRDSITKLTRDY